MGARHSRPRSQLQPELTPEEQRLSNLFEEVFGIEGIKEKILTEVIRNGDDADSDDEDSSKTLSPANAGTLRLFSPDWLATTSAIFIRAREPLFHVKVDRKPLEITPRNLLKVVEWSIRFREHYWMNLDLSAPLIMTLEQGAFATVEAPELSRLIEILSDTPLTELIIKQPNEDLCDAISLPRTLIFLGLQKITIIPQQKRNESKVAFGKFVETLLDATRELREFSIVPNSRRLYCPPNWNYPQTLTSLETVYTTQLMTPPLTRLLPHLKSLKLHNTSVVPIEDGNLLEILDACCSSLEEFSLINRKSLGVIDLDISQFPVLPRLKTLTMSALRWINTGGEPGHVGQRFPALETLSFAMLVGGIHQFVNGVFSCRSPTRSIRHLCLKRMDWLRLDLFPLRAMEDIRIAFPHLVDLTLNIRGENAIIVKNVFRVLTQLQDLTLDFGTFKMINSLNEFDALIVGTTPRMVEQLLKNTDMVNTFLEDANRHPDSELCGPSIRNMVNLESFSVSGFGQDEGGEDLENLIEDVSFDLGFMQVPRLRYLKLTGSFAVVDVIANRWKLHGGTIKSSFV